MSIFEDFEAKNDKKHDLMLAGIYFAIMAAALALAVGILLLEPGNALGSAVENILYIIKIALVAALGLFALYCLIKSISSLHYIIRRKTR